LELYGEWQLELLQLPHAVDGVVPKVLLTYFLYGSPFRTFGSYFLVFNAKMSPRMNEAKLMCGRRSAFHLVQYT